MTPRIVIQIRVTASEKARIQRAARGAASLSSWLRALALREAGKA